jgi:ribosomal protein S18 acetylase RimI-like enzyme
MKIRKAKKEDLKEVAKIMMVESAKKPYNEKYTIKSAVKESKEFFKNEIYVAVNEKEVIGFIASHVISSDKKKGYIDELWLKVAYQGEGAGKMLVKSVEENYKKNGVSGIRLSTIKKAKAYGFYNKLKYKDAALVYMEKKL